MNTLFKTFCLGAGLALGATSASAVTLDLTTQAQFTAPKPSSGSVSSLKGSVGSIGWTLTTSKDKLTFGADNGFTGNENADCKADLGLTCNFDGIGVKDDEARDQQILTLKFDNAVFVTALYFLDLFKGSGPNHGAEAVEYKLGAVTGTVEAEDVLGDTDFSGAGSVKFGNGGIGTSSITFMATGANDNFDSDFALAGLELRSSNDPNEPDVVPLPAGGLLLVGGLGALGMLRRRRKTA